VGDLVLCGTVTVQQHTNINKKMSHLQLVCRLRHARVYKYCYALSLTSVLDGVGGQFHAPGSLPSGKTQYPLYRRLGGPQVRSERVRKNSPPPGFHPRTAESVASRYTDCAILAHNK